MIYKLNNGGIVKLQKAGSVPEYGNIEQIAKYNREHGTHFWKMSQVLEHDKQQAQQKSQNKKKSVWEILAGHPESAGEAILNKSIETANNAELPETRSKIYNDTGKAQLATTAGSLLALPMLGEFSTYGLLGGAARLAGGFGGSAVGSWGLGKVGDWADNRLGINWMGTTGRIIGGFAGWPIGSNFAYKGALDLASKAPSIARIGATDRFIGDVAGRELSNGVKRLTIPVTDLQRNIEAGKIGWAPAATKTLWHNSNDPVSELKINFPAWDVTERKAPLGHVWLTGNETTQGFLAKRPHHLKGKVELNKPMVQIGEAIGDGKNTTRNQILDFAQKSSADGINFQNIADNTLQNQDVYAVFKDVNIKPKLTEAERLGIPKGERNSKIKESVLNWSWQDWFKDRINGAGHIKPNDFDKQSLYRHIPEYRQIEIATKRDGTWLKMPDGTVFEGDPREWVMAQSKAAQGLNFTDYYKLGSGQKPGYTVYFERQRNAPTMIDEIMGNFEGTPGRPAWLTYLKKAEGFANDGRGIGYTYRVYPQNGVTRANFDLQGLDWDSIPVNIVRELNIPVSNGFISTNRIISESPAQIIHLNNVAEGSGGIQNLVDDVIIKGKRKSILGNNGNFDWNNEVIWRKQGGILKAQHGKPSYQDWLKTVNPDFIDENYDLETAYNNLPFELLEAWRIDPENNHLPSGVELQNGNWQYLKSPLHKSWFLNNAWEITKEGKAWKQKYIGDKKFPFETLILKGQHGILTPWYKAYNSKFGKGVRNLMFGKDYDLSDEEYVQKYGYAKPITGTGMLPGKTSMNAFESIEGPLVKGSFGTGAKYNSGLQAMKTKAASKLVEPKTVSNWDKFLKKSLDEQNKIVKYWDERYSTMRQLQANQKQFKRFVNWINKQ